MSYYKPKVRSTIGQGDSFVQGDSQKTGSGQRALCATCGHKFEKGERVFWKTHMSPSRMYSPIKVGVCSTCQRDPEWAEAEFSSETDKYGATRQPRRKGE